MKKGYAIGGQPFVALKARPTPIAAAVHVALLLWPHYYPAKKEGKK